MGGDNKVSFIEIECDTCGEKFYYAGHLGARSIRVRFGLHEFSCRRPKLPLAGNGGKDHSETDTAECDRR